MNHEQFLSPHISVWDINEWEYVNEGSTSLVFRYCASSHHDVSPLFRGHVLRIHKNVIAPTLMDKEWDALHPHEAKAKLAQLGTTLKGDTPSSSRPLAGISSYDDVLRSNKEMIKRSLQRKQFVDTIFPAVFPADVGVFLDSPQLCLAPRCFIHQLLLQYHPDHSIDTMTSGSTHSPRRPTKRLTLWDDPATLAFLASTRCHHPSSCTSLPQDSPFPNSTPQVDFASCEIIPVALSHDLAFLVPSPPSPSSSSLSLSPPSPTFHTLHHQPSSTSSNPSFISPTSSSSSSPSPTVIISFELKPKWGFLPAVPYLESHPTLLVQPSPSGSVLPHLIPSPKYRVCRYCMHQSYKQLTKGTKDHNHEKKTSGKSKNNSTGADSNDVIGHNEGKSCQSNSELSSSDDNNVNSSVPVSSSLVHNPSLSLPSSSSSSSSPPPPPSFCPLDLYSGCPQRRLKAITALIHKPSNNLRIVISSRDESSISKTQRLTSTPPTTPSASPPLSLGLSLKQSTIDIKSLPDTITDDISSSQTTTTASSLSSPTFTRSYLVRLFQSIFHSPPSLSSLTPNSSSSSSTTSSHVDPVGRLLDRLAYAQQCYDCLDSEGIQMILTELDTRQTRQTHEKGQDCIDDGEVLSDEWDLSHCLSMKAVVDTSLCQVCSKKTLPMVPSHNNSTQHIINANTRYQSSPLLCRMCLLNHLFANQASSPLPLLSPLSSTSYGLQAPLCHGSTFRQFNVPPSSSSQHSLASPSTPSLNSPNHPNTARTDFLHCIRRAPTWLLVRFVRMYLVAATLKDISLFITHSPIPSNLNSLPLPASFCLSITDLDPKSIAKVNAYTSLDRKIITHYATSVMSKSSIKEP